MVSAKTMITELKLSENDGNKASMERTPMKESIDRNIKIIIVMILLLIIVVVLGAIAFEYTSNELIVPIVGSFMIASLCVVAISSVGIFRKIQKNRALKQLVYNYNYCLEHDIYRRVGKTKKDGTAKRIENNGILIPNKYSAWKEGLLQRNSALKNNEDFFHFLKYEIRVLRNIRDCIVIIATPLEIGVMTVLLSSYVSRGGDILMAILSAVELLIALVVLLTKNKNETLYVEDIIEVLCPDYCEKK